MTWLVIEDIILDTLYQRMTEPGEVRALNDEEIAFIQSQLIRFGKLFSKIRMMCRTKWGIRRRMNYLTGCNGYPLSRKFPFLIGQEKKEAKFDCLTVMIEEVIESESFEMLVEDDPE